MKQTIILDKDNFTCEHYVINNPKPFITVKLTPKGRLPNKLKIQKGSRLYKVTLLNGGTVSLYEIVKQMS